jgi:hypothetical protein
MAEKGGHTLMMRLLAIDLEHMLLLTTHTMYVAENSQTKEQYQANNIQYCTSKNGCLRYLRK